MDIKLRYKEGKAMAVTETGDARIIKLVLKDEFLEIMEKLNPSKFDDVAKLQQIVSKQKMATESSFTYSKLPIERTVEIMMDDSNSSLGISVKGGTDFNLPILISRIIPGETADKTNQLFIGDVILDLNGRSMLQCTHKEAVDSLLNAGSRVTLLVRHLPHAATILLNEGIFKKQLSSIDDKHWENIRDGTIDTDRPMATDKDLNHGFSNHDSVDNIHHLPPDQYSYLVNNSVNRKYKKDSKNWVIGLRLSLQYAYLSVFQYHSSVHMEKYNSFVVRSIEGHCTGNISFKDPSQFHYWKEAIKFNINSLIIHNIKKYNETSSNENQVHYMGWLYFVGESNKDLMKTCQSYYESEYANINTVADEMKETASKAAKIQCVSRKHKSLNSSPVAKGCHLREVTTQWSIYATPTKKPTSEHSRKPPKYMAEVLQLGEHRTKKYSSIDRPLFIVLRGIHIFIFSKPPTVLGEWFCPLKQYLVSRSMLVRRRKVCNHVNTSDSDNNIPTQAIGVPGTVPSNNNCKDREPSATHFILKIEMTEFECVTDSYADLLELEKIWIRVNYYAVCQMRVDSFKCIYQNIDCFLCLDFDYGLKLINAADGIRIWQYKFHQLKGSSDDSDNRLRLMFSDHINMNYRVDQVLHCHRLGTLLISIQSFLTAKLGQVDPHYFDN